MVHVKRRAQGLPDGWELGRITQQEERTPRRGIDVHDQIVQKQSRPESSIVIRLVGDHGCLINNEKRVLKQIGGYGEIG